MMDTQYHFTTTEEERASRRAQRTAARKQRQRARRRALLLRTLPVAALALLAAGTLLWALGQKAGTQPPAGIQPAVPHQIPPAGEPDPGLEPYTPLSAQSSAATVRLGEDFSSGYAVLIDVEAGTVLAEKNAWTAVSPASMTKILTVLVAAEQVENLDAAASITPEIAAYCLENDCSMAGFLAGESPAARDLFYGTILPSGAEAALALANLAAGSQEAFVELMNEKAEALGTSAHFTNCVGLYSPENLCSVYDMAVILKAAMDNELCRDVLARKTYDIPANELREDPLNLSNWFIRRIEDHMPVGMEILGAKTGFINEAGNCAASCVRGPDGKLYICVTALGSGIWPCIFDHVALYEMACGG